MSDNQLPMLPLKPIFIAMISALVLGFVMNAWQLEAVFFVELLTLVGKLFLNGLKMVVVPLIIASMIVSIANLKSGLGRLGSKTLIYYMASSTLAILIGLFVANAFDPGLENGAPNAALKATLPELPADKAERLESADLSEMSGVFLRMVPPNIVQAAVDGQMLGLIVFSILFGYFMRRVGVESFATLKDFWDGVLQTMLHITHFVMRFAPIGIFALITKTVATTGLEAMKPLLLFFITVLVALLLHLFVALPILLNFIGNISPVKHFNAMVSALVTAFSTASSAATLPVTMRCLESRVGVSNKTSSFVLPLGATVNMDGTALYECVAALFIAQVYGLDLTLGTQLIIVLTALITSVGVAGIPAASLVAISIILGVLGLPVEAIGLILITDRILDMFRTAVNVYSDSCGAAVIAKTEGESLQVDKA